MNSDALKVFVSVARSGGFAVAADALGRSQPAVSRRIATLEEEIGAPLFERATGGVRLTSVGCALLPHAERVLAALSDCARATRAATSGGTGEVSLVAVGTLAGAPLSRALRDFAAEWPSVDLRLATATSAEASRLVASGEADIGLRYGRDASAALASRPLGGERMAVVAAPGHPCLGLGAAPLSALAGETWLRFPGADRRLAPGPDPVFAWFAARDLPAPDWRAVDSLTAQKRLVEAGFGLALLPLSAIAEEVSRGSLAVVPVADLDAANPIHLVTRKDGWLSPAAEALIDALAEVDWNG